MAGRVSAGRVWCNLPVARVLAAVAVAIGAGTSIAAVTAAGATTAATVQLSSTSAKATQVTYTVGFTSPGSLAAGSGTISLTAPTGTVLPTDDCDYTVVDTTSTRSGGCPTVVLGAGDKSATITTGIAVATADGIVVTVEGVANPGSAGARSLKITTSAGGSLAAAYTLTAATSVSGLSLSASSTSAGASEVTDTFSFTAPNGLTPGISQIVVVGPKGMAFSPTSCSYSLYDGSSEQTSNCPPVSVTGGNTVVVTPEITTSPGDPLRLTISGVANPGTAGSDSITVHTTSDPVTASVPLTVTAATAVSGLSFTTTASSAGATGVTDVVSFVTTNSLTAGTSRITVTAPSGSELSSDGCDYAVANPSTKHSSSCLPVTVSTAGNAVTLVTNTSVAGGAKTVVTIEGLSNPTAKKTGTLSVSTSSDPTAVSAVDDITAATTVKSFSLVAGAHAVSATGVTYTATFVSTSGLTSGTSAVRFTAPAGTVFPAFSCGSDEIENLTTGQSNGCLSGTITSNVLTVTSGITAKPGNKVQLVMNDVTNAASTGSSPVHLSTTSDPGQVSTTLSLTAATKVKNLTFTSNDRSTGALRAQYTVTFSATGGLNRSFGRIVLTVPAGTVLPTTTCDVYVVTDDTTGQSNGCTGATVSGDTVSIQAGLTINAGDAVTVTVAKVDNPAKAVNGTIKLSTSSDATVASTTFAFVAPEPLKDLTFVASSHAAGAKGVSYTFTFVVTGGMTADTSTITITGTTATTTVTFPTPTGSCGEYTDLNTTTGTGWACAGGTSSTTGTSVTFTPDESATTGNTFTITINNVTNPKKVGTATFKVHSSFDPKPVTVSLPLTEPTSVEKLSFKPTSYAATATEVTDSVTFVATGGLTQRYSTITLAEPAGTTLPAGTTCPYHVTDTTNGQSGNCETVTLLDGGSTAVIALPIDVRPGDGVNLTVYGVANPTTAGSDTVSLSTSSDAVVATAPFTVTAASKVTSPTLVVTGTSSPYKATVGFGAKNGLTSQYSTITLTAPAGTVLPSVGCDYTVSDTTDGQTAGCPAVQSNGTAVTLTLPLSVRPKDGVQVVVETVTGTKPSKLTVATSSDPVTTSA